MEQHEKLPGDAQGQSALCAAVHHDARLSGAAVFVCLAAIARIHARELGLALRHTTQR